MRKAKGLSTVGIEEMFRTQQFPSAGYRRGALPRKRGGAPPEAP